MEDPQQETASMLANEDKAEKKLEVASSGSGLLVVKGAGNMGGGGKVKSEGSPVKTTNTPSSAGIQVKLGQSVLSCSIWFERRPSGLNSFLTLPMCSLGTS